MIVFKFLGFKIQVFIWARFNLLFSIGVRYIEHSVWFNNNRVFHEDLYVLTTIKE